MPLNLFKRTLIKLSLRALQQELITYKSLKSKLNGKAVSLLLFFILLSTSGFSQVLDKVKLSKERNPQRFVRDTLNQGNQGSTKVNLDGKTKWTDYKIISAFRDTTYIDTTLTIKKHYRFNFRRKDNFELLPFHNIGQTFNSLGYSFERLLSNLILVLEPSSFSI